MLKALVTSVSSSVFLAGCFMAGAGLLRVGPSRYGGAMTTATRVPFADAEPADVRAALLAEQRGEFDADYEQALQAAREQLSLRELDRVLTTWRRVAALVQADPEGYRRMLRTADATLRTGQPRAGSRPWHDVAAQRGL